jgi:uncharacterized protein
MQKELSEVGCLVKTIVCHLVKHPEAVRLEELRASRTVVLELRVAPGDQGRIIGRDGRMASALRELLTNIGARTDRRYLLNILGHDQLERLATAICGASLSAVASLIPVAPVGAASSLGAVADLSAHTVSSGVVPMTEALAGGTMHTLERSSGRSAFVSEPAPLNGATHSRVATDQPHPADDLLTEGLSRPRRIHASVG